MSGLSQAVTTLLMIVPAENPLVGETLTRCWPVYHMAYREAVRLGKATELYTVTLTCLVLQTHLILQITV